MKEKIVPICDLFVSIQGEGIYSGEPSIFIRVSGCNLRCVFKNSICDTPYSSFHPEKSSFSYDDVKNIINNNPNIDHIVITGGEPLLYKTELESLLADIWEPRLKITIETNGTLPILNPLNTNYKINLYSVSPKLHTSVPQVGQKVETNNGTVVFGTEEVKRLNDKRINLRTLLDVVCYSEKYQFKWVYSDDSCIEEIQDIYNQLENKAEREGILCYNYFKTHHPNKNTQLMPEGINTNQLTSISDEVLKICIEKGWRYCDRLHIRLFGDKRGV